MSRKETLKPKPAPDANTVIANKKRAAVGQLESAIPLWFSEADPISILVLATNAHNCFHAIGSKVGKPSWYQEFVDQLPQPLRDEFLERSNYIQNFAKHGFMDLGEDTDWVPDMADALIIISLDCCQLIYGSLTRLMRLFRMRFFSERPMFAPKDQQQMFSDGAAIYNFGSGSRKKFFKEFEPRLDFLPPHMQRPPELEPL